MKCMRPGWPGPGCCASRPPRSWRMSFSRCTRGPSSITAWRWAGCATTARRWIPTAMPKVPSAASTPASGRSGSTPTMSAAPGSRTRPMIAGTGLSGSTPPGWGRRSAARPPGMRGGSPPGRTAGPTASRRCANCWPAGIRAWSPGGANADGGPAGRRARRAARTSGHAGASARRSRAARRPGRSR